MLSIKTMPTNDDLFAPVWFVLRPNFEKPVYRRHYVGMLRTHEKVMFDITCLCANGGSS